MIAYKWFEPLAFLEDPISPEQLVALVHGDPSEVSLCARRPLTTIYECRDLNSVGYGLNSSSQVIRRKSITFPDSLADISLFHRKNF